ncbi:MAG: MtrAB system histidine kinase MtrB [Canibacter sp.]
MAPHTSRTFRNRWRRAKIKWARVTHPIFGPFRRRWSRSIALRLMTITGIVTGLMIIVLGTFIMTSIRDDLTSSRRDQSLQDSARATISAQQRIDSSDASDRSALSSLMTAVRATIRDTSSSSLIYVRQQPGQPESADAPQSFTTDPGFVKSISDDMLNAVLNSNEPQLWQFTTLVSSTGEGEPGIVIATELDLPSGAGVYDLFIGYSFDDIEESLGFVQRTLLVTAVVLMLLIGLLVFIISRVVFKPIRAAADASKRLAAGESDARMKYQNDVYFDVLSDNFNDMADTLGDRIEELDALSNMQQRFVSDVSHELRTPLTTIRLASELLGGAENLPPSQQRAVNVLSEQVERFEALLADLLEISRYDAGRVQIDTEPTQLVPLCEGVIEQLQPLTESMIELRPLGGYGEIEVDPRRIRRIVSNLIGNAIEHGEGRPIIVEIDSNASAFAVAVRDYGIGMTEEATKHVFDRFWRADPSRKRTLGGTGLGLAIALEDAQVHGGALEVWSKKGVGTNFRLTLPRSDQDSSYLSPLLLIPDEFTAGDTATTGGWLKRPKRWLSRGGR